MMKKNLINVDGKLFAKTLTFGNRNKRVIFSNKRKYDRRKVNSESWA